MKQCHYRPTDGNFCLAFAKCIKPISSVRWDQFERLKKILWEWWREVCSVAARQQSRLCEPYCVTVLSVRVWDSRDCLGRRIWIAHSGWLILWGFVSLQKKKKKFYSHKKSAELFINYRSLHNQFTLCRLHWILEQSPTIRVSRCIQQHQSCQTFLKRGRLEHLLFFKPKSQRCYSVIRFIKSMFLELQWPAVRYLGLWTNKSLLAILTGHRQACQ